MRPHERDEALLQDMVVHCREVQEFTRGVGLEQLMRDRRLCLLIERCLEIVGEAASRVSQEFRDAHAQIPWQEIRGLRNVLAHEYGNIEYDVLYATATKEVPTLIVALEGVLGTGAGEPPGVQDAPAPYARVVRPNRRKQRGPKIDLPISKCRGGFAPGIDPLSNRSIYAAMYAAEDEEYRQLCKGKP